jgi:hypothetical protein
MAVVTATTQLLIDFGDVGLFTGGAGTDLAGYWLRDKGSPFSLTGLGRQKEHDAAGMASFTCQLDNKDGRFSTKNASSPYYPNWTPYKRVQANAVYNGTQPLFTGILTDIKLSPGNNEQLCEITLRDFMYVLSRTEISRKVMRGQYTGTIIDRILDDVEGAEGREWVANPIFEINDTGYSTFGTASKSRVTTGEFLEGGAAETCTTSATFSGLAYTFPDNKANQYVTAAIYAKPEGDSEIGKTIRLRLWDDVTGFLTLASGTLASRDHWTRLTSSTQFTAGSTSQQIRIEASASGTSFRAGAFHGAPRVNGIARATDEGLSFFDQYFYHRGPALQAIQEVRDNELGGLFYFSGDGVAHFEQRNHRWLPGPSMTSQNTFIERGVFDYTEDADDRVKAVILDYPHYVDGDAGTVIWELDRVVSIPSGGTITIEADYQGGLVRNTITPVVNVDYTITGAGDGSGGDYSGLVTFTFQDFGGGATATFTNASIKTVYLRTYRIRGTPAREAADRSPARYTATGGPALAATLSHDYKWNGSEPAVAAWAEYLGLRYSAQRERLTVRLSAPWPKADDALTDMTPILNRQLSDRVTFTNTALPFALELNSTPYYIDAISLRCPGDYIEATWRLAPVDAAYLKPGDTVALSPATNLVGP